jgi:hypothetical protein
MNNEQWIADRMRVSGRACGSCSLCCKLLKIPELNNKPAGVWCPHCKPGKGGCQIYPNRPDVCRKFACRWLVDHRTIPDHWQPTKAQMFIWISLPTLWITVDPHFPDAWRQEPYYSEIKEFSLLGLLGIYSCGVLQTYIMIGNKRFLILPNKDIPIRSDHYTVVLRVDEGQWECIQFKDEKKARQTASIYYEILDEMAQMKQKHPGISHGEARSLVEQSMRGRLKDDPA